ncbi:hypothetical protein GCM10023169_22220 [Georgenia halophila]|uniref:DUF4190 domain-containing protein n=1 Tax=Georgenia halophila TaxID=620889 RepID=A0ABP8L989_9MICO
MASLAITVVALLARFGFGSVALAMFAVGAGHVALRQINERQERGAILAYISLAVCYLMASWILVLTIAAVPSLVAQLFPGW